MQTEHVDFGAAPTAEAVLLGCIFIDPRLLSETRHVMQVDHFTLGSHREVWRAMCAIEDAGDAVDALSVCDKLRSRIDSTTGTTLLQQVGGASRVARFSADVVSTMEFESALRIVMERRTRRALGRALADAKQKLEDGHDAAVVVDALNGDIELLADPRAAMADSSSHASSIAKEVWSDLESGEPLLPRLPTGIRSMDQLLDGGLALGLHYIVAALSGHGKTTIASSMVAGLLEQNPDLHVDWYGCEVPRKWQFTRIASAWANVPESFWRRRQEQEITTLMSRAVEALGWGVDLGSRLRIFHHPSLGMRDIALSTSVRRRALEGKPLLVVVDYIQRAWAGESHKPNERIAAASSMLASLADDKTATIALTQFTAEASATEPIPVPKHTQARWAQDIRDDACDFIIYHRPTLESCPPVALLQLAKSRYGRLAHSWVIGSPSNRFDSFHSPGSEVIRACEKQYPGVELKIPQSVKGLHTAEIRP